jgi:hypothetical protein
LEFETATAIDCKKCQTKSGVSYKEIKNVEGFAFDSCYKLIFQIKLLTYFFEKNLQKNYFSDSSILRFILQQISTTPTSSFTKD